MAKNLQISDLAHAKLLKAQAKIQIKTGVKPTLPETLDKLLKVENP